MGEFERLRAELDRVQAALADAQARLAQEVVRHQDTEARLRQQAQALARSNSELEQFAYAASHDLQAPLRSITGFSQLLMKHSAGKLDEKCDEYLEYIESSARHLHLLVNDLLEYSRVGRAEQKLEWVESGDVVRQVAREAEADLRRRQGAVLHANLPRVFADGRQLLQLFSHLVGNAIKYSRDGVAPEIRITAQSRDTEWEFAVQDNGIGMQPHETARIFTIFQRLHTLERYEGTGIGLAICQKIVERHGGRIWAESAPDRGATFHFTLRAPESQRQA